MKFIEFITRALSEADGHPSSIRVFGAWAIFFFVIALSFGFIYIVFTDKNLVIAFAGILSALISTILGMKVWQKGKEEKDDDTS
jgi:hypothetical protein